MRSRYSIAAICVPLLLVWGCGEVERQREAGADGPGRADSRQADGPGPDGAPGDLPGPEAAHDLLRDALPDAGPDGAAPKTLTDDTFADFSQGTLSGSGAKIYVSARGNVQLTDRLDLNGDGYLDIAFSNKGSMASGINSYIYWGGSGGLSATNRTELPTRGTVHCNSQEPGSVVSRQGEQTFTSRVLDSGSASPTYLSLSWTATLPKSTSLRFQLRSATSAGSLASASWFGPTSGADYYEAKTASGSLAVSAAHQGHRYLQYGATLASTDMGSSPVLDMVALSYRWHPGKRALIPRGDG